MRSEFNKAFFIAVILLVAGLNICAGQPLPYETEIKTGHIPLVSYESRIQYVTVPCSVLNEEGQYVKGLTREDFIVTEEGKVQNVIDFKALEPSPRIVILADCSRSIYKYLWVERNAVSLLLDQLPPGSRIAMAGFNNKVFTIAEFTDDIGKLKTGVAELEAKGGTALYLALEWALERLAKDAEEPQWIIVFSDGREPQSGEKEKKNEKLRTSAIISDCKFRRIPIYTIGIGIDVGVDLLRRFSYETGGFYRHVTGDMTLKQLFLDQITLQAPFYRLGYISENNKAVRQWRDIKVISNLPDTQVIHKRGYFPSENSPFLPVMTDSAE